MFIKKNKNKKTDLQQELHVEYYIRPIWLNYYCYYCTILYQKKSVPL